MIDRIILCGIADFFIFYMPKTRAQKEEIVVDLVSRLDRMKAAVFVNYQGIKVLEVEDLRRRLHAHKIEYLVVKNTLMRLALEKSKIGIKINKMSGQIGVLLSYEDEVRAAKIVAEFAREHPTMKLRAGFLAGEMIDQAKVIELSKLPSEEELLARVVGSINAPISNFVGVLRAEVASIVHVIRAIAKEKEA